MVISLCAAGCNAKSKISDETRIERTVNEVELGKKD